MNEKVRIVDSNDEDQVKRGQEISDDQDRDLDFILAQPRGRRWLYHLIKSRCHVDLLSHVPGHPDASAFNDGARSVGLAIEGDIKARSPKMYMKMLEENDFDD